MIDELKKMLESYQQKYPDESSLAERFRGLLENSPDPGSRYNFQPGHLTASAFVLSPDKKSLLLLKHKKLGKWLQPGGHLDGKSSLWAEAARETFEETGVKLAPRLNQDIFDLDIHVIPGKASEPKHEHFDVRFLMTAITEEINPCLSETDGVRYVLLEEVGKYTAEESILRPVRKIKVV